MSQRGRAPGGVPPLAYDAGLTLFRFWLAVSTAALSVLIALTPARAGNMQRQSRPVVRILTALAGGGFHALATDLVNVYRQAMPSVSFEARPEASATASVELIQRGEADVTFAFADHVYLAYVGRTQSGQPPFDRLRVIADLGATPVQLLTRKGLRISAITDLKGRRVAVGLPGSATQVTFGLIVRAFAMQMSDIRTENMGTTEAGQRLADGTLDAAFSVTIYPAEGLRVATAAGARLVPIAGPPIERLRRAYPFFRIAMIPRKSYPEVDYDVLTVGVNSLLLCRRDLDEGLVYDMTRIFFQALPTLPSGTALRTMDVERAAAAPIPLHEGAARYYREQELIK
jgi:TRAP transporter TAXI family solute receptor